MKTINVRFATPLTAEIRVRVVSDDSRSVPPLVPLLELAAPDEKGEPSHCLNDSSSETDEVGEHPVLRPDWPGR